MERSFRHEITYTNSGLVPVSEVAASLLANERLFREAIETLQNLYPDLEITETSITFRRASSDSPLQQAFEAVAKFVFQDDLDKRIPDAIQALTGVEIPKDLDGMVSLLVIAITTYGISWLLTRRRKGGDDDAITVNGNYNNIVKIGHLTLGVSEQDFHAAIEGRFSGNRGQILARRALDLIRPARIEDGAAVTAGGATITPETVAAAPLPGPGDHTEENESQDAYTNQTVVIHATDLDSQKSGWAGHLPGIWEKRLPMRLFPAIRPSDLFGKHQVTGDVILISRRNAEGDFVPYLFHLIGID